MHKKTSLLRAGHLAVAMSGVLAPADTASPTNASTLQIVTTVADVPLTFGQPNQDYEGNYFTGIPLYDMLAEWDLSQGEKPSGLVPGLATEQHINPQNISHWIFTLRPDIRLYGGMEVNVDAIVWDVDKVLNKTAPQYTPGQTGNTLSRMPTLTDAGKIDDRIVALTTSEPDVLPPYNITNLFIVSSTAWQKQYDAAPASAGNSVARSKQAQTAFVAHAVGNGPFKLEKLVLCQQLVLNRNPDYWNRDCILRVDKVVLIPLPEADARTAALLSKQVDWIEAPVPDAINQIKSQGFHLYTNAQPYLWLQQLSFGKGLSWQDIRVRRVANLCLNRAELKSYLGGYMTGATGVYEADNPWHGRPTFQIKHDSNTARQLMTEAGYSTSKLLHVAVATSASDSRQIQPLPVNERIQQSLRSCFFNVGIKVVEWSTLFTNWRPDARDPSAKGIGAISANAAVSDLYFSLIRFSTVKVFPSVAANWGCFSTPETEKLAAAIKHVFIPAETNQAADELHVVLADQVPSLFVAHDIGSRTISPAVTGIVQPQSWFIDPSLVSKKE